MSSVESQTGGIQISLTTEEATVLREALGAYLSELRLETARTDDKSFRDHLWERERFIERILGQLGASS